jgi:hypothetical protein
LRLAVDMQSDHASLLVEGCGKGCAGRIRSAPAFLAADLKPFPALKRF